MEQITLFDDDEMTEIIIPLDVISPLESKKNVWSKEFKQQQLRWKHYVKSVQNTYNCSWFEARKILIKHRDNPEPIRLRLVENEP